MDDNDCTECLVCLSPISDEGGWNLGARLVCQKCMDGDLADAIGHLCATFFAPGENAALGTFVEKIRGSYWKARSDWEERAHREDHLEVQSLRRELAALTGSASAADQKTERAGMSNSLRYNILRRDNFHCQLCGATGKETTLHVDHIIPVSKGGKTEPENLRVLCFACNSGKRDKVE